MWCIGKITPEYLKRMYDILDLYQEPYNPKKPVIGVDEKSKQLLGEKRMPIPLRPGKIEKYDYEYVRNGSANIFVAVEPKYGKRITRVTEHRTKKDFANFMRDMVWSYPIAEKLRIVLDNLNTHFESSFYEAFEKIEADSILSKLEFHYTPKHASWLNVAEIEIGALDAQCTGRRMRNISFLREEVKACTKMRNKEKCKIDWRFTKEDADKKLAKHYVT